MLAGLLALIVIAASAAGVAVNTAVNASRQHAIALSRLLAEEGLALASSDPLTARQLAVAAWRVYPTTKAGSVMTTLLAGQQDGFLPGDPAGNGVSGIAFNPDGKLLATADADGTVTLWNTATRHEIGAPLLADTGTRGVSPVTSLPSGVDGVAFSPDGTLLASAYGVGIVTLLNPDTGRAPHAPIFADPASGPGGQHPGVSGVAFNPHGTLLAGGDGTVQLWDPATGRAAVAPLQAGNVAGG